MELDETSFGDERSWKKYILWDRTADIQLNGVCVRNYKEVAEHVGVDL